MTVSRVLEIDVAGVLSDCGLRPDDELAGVLEWHSSWTNLRGGSGPMRLAEGANRFALDLPGDVLGARLTLELRAVLAQHVLDPAPLAPRRWRNGWNANVCAS